MIVETGTLTTVLDQFLEIFRLGEKAVGDQAWSLLTKLAGIEIVLASLWWAYTGQDALIGLIRRLLSIGFIVFVVQNYDRLLHTIIDGFIQTGHLAAGPNGQQFNFVRDPSTIVDAGYVATLPIFEHLRSYSGLDVISNLHDIIITALCAIGIVGAYFIIAIQVFVTYLEFGIVSTLGLILVPFGAFKHTAFLAEKVFGSIISFGVKLMVLGLLVSVTVPVIKQFTVTPSPDWKPLFNLLLVCLATAALAWHAPGVAAGLLAGGPSLTAGTAVGTAHAAASGAMAAPYIARNVASSTFQSGANAVKTATSIGAGTLGLATAGGIATAAKIKSAGYGSTAQVLGGAVGAGYAVAADAAKSAWRPFQQLGISATETFTAKQSTVSRYVGMKAKEALSAGQPSLDTTKPEKPEKPTPQPPPKEKKPEPRRDDFSRVKTALQLTKQSIPQTAHPMGGISVPLNPKGDKSNE